VDASQNVTLAGTLTATGVTTVPAGTVSAPAITTTGDTNTGIFFPAADTIAFSEGGVESMRIDSDGDVGIGTASPSYKLHVVGGSANNFLLDNGGQQYTQLLIQRNGAVNTGGDILVDGTNSTFAIRSLLAGPMIFATSATAGAGTERARIDSSGNLLVGTTSTLGASGVLQLLGSMDAQAVTRCSAASAGQYWRYGADSGNSFLVYSSNASGGVYIANASTSWSGRSDERLKDIIEPITDAANKVSNLRAVIGKFKTDEEGTRRSFLIAQDVQAVLPEAVSVSPRKEGEDTDYLGVAYTDVIPLLVAAIKEQQAIITQLQADVAALKGASA
jgi:hypothetical protein